MKKLFKALMRVLTPSQRGTNNDLLIWATAHFAMQLKKSHYRLLLLYGRLASQQVELERLLNYRAWVCTKKQELLC